jgi:hypothetical protein
MVSVTSLCLLTAGGSMTSRDPVVAYDVTRNLIEHGSITVSDSLMEIDAYRGRGGHYYSPFGIAQSIWNVPFYLAGRTLTQRFAFGNAETLPKALVALGTAPAVGLLAWACFELLIALQVSRIRALHTAALTVVATPLWPYSSFGFNQPLTGLFLWTAVLFAVVDPDRTRTLALSALSAGAAILTRHEMILPAAVLGAAVALRARANWRRALVAYAAGLALPLAIWCGLNWWRFGHPLESGYLRDPTPGYGSSLLEGTLGFLFSPYASLFLYCPVAVLAYPAWRSMRRSRPREAWLFLALFASLFALYASLGNWMGGRSYGPRYLVPLLPALTLPLAFWSPGLRARAIVMAVVLVSVLVQVPGVLVDYAKVRVDRARAGETVAQDTRWSGTPLLLNARATIIQVPRSVRQLAGFERRPVVERDARDLSMALSFSPDLWWLYLWYLDVIDRLAVAFIAVSLAGVAVFGFARARRLAMR